MRRASGNRAGSFDFMLEADVLTLREILVAGPPRLRLLAGHSRGNLLISFVLNHLSDDLGDGVSWLRRPRHPLSDHLVVVTLGAVVDIPSRELNLHTHQFLGQFDWLGQMNSLRYPPFLGAIANEHETIKGAGHHLNPIIPCAMSVADALRRAGLP
jgi:hypothetical protein